ncbi:hypothetical protein [Mycobacterium paraffinicum]|nr:hypothetical protein [Mycobacterium paraffinicum]
MTEPTGDVEVRAYAELNDFLPPGRTARSWSLVLLVERLRDQLG